MHKNSKRLLSMAIAAALGAPFTAYATNGMNLAGYGPIATAMGGASMAYDNGTAAVMNNPATLGLMGDGARVDVAVGVLGPDVKTTNGAGAQYSSGGDSYVMPAFGYARKSNDLTYGLGLFAQGGMGTEYSSSLWSGLTTFGGTITDKERSEVGVGRLLLPLAYNVNSNLTVGGSVDYVWATMDLKMVAPFAMMNSMITGGGLAAALAPAMSSGNYDYGYFDFSDNNDFSGAAKGSGFAGKIGFTYRLSDELTLGAVFHSKTSLSDLEAHGATMSLKDSTGTNAPYPVTGTIKVVGFEWPETWGMGFSYKPNDTWLIAGDVKYIKWADVMKNFNMTFVADGSGLDLSMTMPQNWDNQTVFEFGATYVMNQNWTFRGGVNVANNPIPNSTLHYLFPAIIENHVTAGVGYAFDKDSQVNFSLTHAPSVTQASSATGMTTKHAQTSWQLMYSHNF